MAAVHNLVIRPGVTFIKTFNWYTKDSVTLVKTPVNLTGYTARMDIRENVGDVAAVLTCTTENGRISLNASGEIKIIINAATTSAYTTELAVYDLLLIAPGGDVTEFISGSVTLKKGVTA
jgi:hypothetical protein